MKFPKWLLILILTLTVFFSFIFFEWVKSKNEALQFVYPDNGEYLKIDDLTSIFYRQIGKGPDILLIHGIGASQFIWKDLESRLKSHYKLTMIDLPGFGRSSKHPDLKLDIESQSQVLEKIIHKLHLNSVYIVGSSMGGTIGLWLAMERPDLVQKIAVIGPAANPQLMPLPLYKVPQLSYFIKFFVNKWLIRTSISRVLTHADLVTEERVLYSLKNFHNHPNSMYCFFLGTEALSDARIPAIFNKIQQDVLILSGREDKAVKSSYIEELHNNLSHSQLYFHPSGGHHLMEDEPDWVSQNLLLFLTN